MAGVRQQEVLNLRTMYDTLVDELALLDGEEK